MQVWNPECLGVRRPLCNGQVKISDSPPEASSRAGCGAQGEQELELGPSASRGRKGTPGRGDWVSGVGHRREQGVGAASHEVVWVAGQERPMPPSRQVWVPPLPNPCAGCLLTGLCGYEQLSSGCFFSAAFSCSVPSFERYAPKLG